VATRPGASITDHAPKWQHDESRGRIGGTPALGTWLALWPLSGLVSGRTEPTRMNLPITPFSKNFVMRARLFIDSITSGLPTNRRLSHMGLFRTSRYGLGGSDIEASKCVLAQESDCRDAVEGNG
jgi:hypothetical protein